MFFYDLYGFGIQSNQRIGSLKTNDDTSYDLNIVFGQLPVDQRSFEGESQLRYTETTTDGTSQSNVKISYVTRLNYYYIQYLDQTSFVINSSASTVWAIWVEPLTFEDTVVYLLGQVFGFILRLRGVVSLHASAISVDGRVLALIGPHGAGKSTTAAAFAKLGYSILCDDVVPLRPTDGEFLVHPGYPRLRLWPSSVEMLYGAPDALPLLTPNWDKRYLNLEETDYHFQTDPAPLGGIYILEDRDPSLTRPKIEPVSKRDALITLTGNTYVNYLLDKDMRKHEFDVLQQVVNRIPVKRIAFPADPAHLAASCEALADDFRHTISQK